MDRMLTTTFLADFQYMILFYHRSIGSPGYKDSTTTMILIECDEICVIIDILKIFLNSFEFN